MKLFAKLLCVLLCLTMVLSFAACGDEAPASDDTAKKDDAATTTTEDDSQDVGDLISSAMLIGAWTGEVDFLPELKADLAHNESVSAVLENVTADYKAAVTIEFFEDGTFEYAIADEDAFETTIDAFVEDFLKNQYDYYVENKLTSCETYEEWYDTQANKRPNTIILKADQLDRDGYWFYKEGKIYLSDAVCDTYFEITLEGDVLTFTKGVNTHTYIEDVQLPLAFTKEAE